MISKVKEKHPDWSEGWQLRGAVAAYNFGAKNVQTKAGIDMGSASTCSPCDGNYSWDTMQRARWLADNQRKGWQDNYKDKGTILNTVLYLA